jgi:putative tryptophan/tyrosine transport system substrate-binding protein
MAMNRMKRIYSIILVVGFILAGTTAQAADKTIGVIMTGGIPYYKELHKSFTDNLAAEGYGPARVEIVLQTPTPEAMSWVNAARKLVAIGSDIIVSYGAPATLVVMKETSAIPIVFAGVYDPQSAGINGKNVTGISSKVPLATLMKNFKIITNYSKVGVIYNDAEKDTVLQANEVKQLEGNFGFSSSRINFRKVSDVSKIANVDAILLTTSCVAMQCVNNIVGTARQAKIPTATTIGVSDDSGIILVLSANAGEQGRDAAVRVAKIFNGVKPGSLPVEQPRKIDMIINLKEAGDLGLKIPFDILSSATKVIK